MKITVKQAKVLDNLHRIVAQNSGRRRVLLLDGEDCRFQINSLCAKGLITRDRRGRPVKVADPDGIVGAKGWPARTAGEAVPTAP